MSVGVAGTGAAFWIKLEASGHRGTGSPEPGWQGLGVGARGVSSITDCLLAGEAAGEGFGVEVAWSSSPVEFCSRSSSLLEVVTLLS